MGLLLDSPLGPLQSRRIRSQLSFFISERGYSSFRFPASLSASSASVGWLWSSPYLMDITVHPDGIAGGAWPSTNAILVPI